MKDMGDEKYGNLKIVSRNRKAAWRTAINYESNDLNDTERDEHFS